jgi:hypothetical protein
MQEITANEDMASAADGFQPIPEGDYELVCQECKEKTAKSGGTYLSAKFKVEGPTHEGRFLFAQLTLTNANAKAVEIGQKQLHAWCLMAGLEKVSAADDFVATTIKARVTVKKKDAYTDPATGKVYPERLDNIIQFHWKKGGPPQVSTKPVDKTGSW